VRADVCMCVCVPGHVWRLRLRVRRVRVRVLMRERELFHFSTDHTLSSSSPPSLFPSASPPPFHIHIRCPMACTALHCTALH
jgi:hypothetical protein